MADNNIEITITGNTDPLEKSLEKANEIIEGTENQIATSVMNTISTINNIKGVVEGLFASIKKNPIGLAVTAASALVGLISEVAKAKKTKWDQHLKDIRDENAKLSDEENALAKKIDEASEAYDGFKQAKDNAIDNSQTEWDYYQTLWNKLQSIVDQNGNIITGQDEVAKGITEKLYEATGVEFTFGDGMIEHYQETASEIQNVIDKQKALALQSALGDSYTEANLGLSDAAARYAAAKKALDEQNVLIDEKQKAYDQAKAEWEEIESIDTRTLPVSDPRNDPEYVEEKHQLMEEAEAALKGAKSAADGISRNEDDVDLQVNFDNAEKEYFGFLQTINEYDTLSTAIANGDTKAINRAVSDINNHLIKAETGTKKQLEEQITDAERNLENYKEGLSQGLAGITEETVANAEEFLEQAKAELAEFNLYEVINEYENAENQSKGSLERQIIDMDNAYLELETIVGESDLDKQMTDKYLKARTNASDQLKCMVSDYDKYLKEIEKLDALADFRKSANKIYKSFLADEDGNGNGWGAEIGTSLFNGIIAGLQESSSMKDQNLAMVLDTQVRQARKALGINSPSKVTKKMLGKPMGQGITVGNVEAIKEGAKDVEKALDDDLLKPLSKKSFTLSPSVILSAQQAARSTAQRAASSVTTTNIHNITNNAYSQAQQTSGDKYVQESVISFERGVNDLVDFLAPKIETRTRRVGRKAVAKLG